MSKNAAVEIQTICTFWSLIALFEVSADAQEKEEVPAWRLESQRVVGSTDFKSYYPSLPIQRTAEIVGEMIERSEVKILTDNKELGLFLASTMAREEVMRLNLGGAQLLVRAADARK